MVVVIILAVLLGIAIPVYFVLKERALESSTEAEMKNMVHAIELYKKDNGQYPPEDSFPADIAHYYQQLPSRDSWGSPYVYELTAESYQLKSSGKDKIPGTGDDIVFEEGNMVGEGAYHN